MKNKASTTFLLSSILLLLIGVLVYKFMTPENEVAQKRTVKKFAERKTFIPDTSKPTNVKITKKEIKKSDDSKTINVSGKQYLVSNKESAKRIFKNGIVTYQKEHNTKGMPLLTNPNNGMEAVFTGNIMVKVEDESLLNEVIDKFGLKLVQQFKHLGTYYLGAKDPNTILNNMNRINEVLKDSRIEYELIENPIKLK